MCMCVCVCVWGGGLRPFRMMASDVLTLQQRTVEGGCVYPFSWSQSLSPPSNGRGVFASSRSRVPPTPPPTNQTKDGVRRVASIPFSGLKHSHLSTYSHTAKDGSIYVRSL